MPPTLAPPPTQTPKTHPTEAAAPGPHPRPEAAPGKVRPRAPSKAREPRWVRIESHCGERGGLGPARREAGPRKVQRSAPNRPGITLGQDPIAPWGAQGSARRQRRKRVPEGCGEPHSQGRRGEAHRTGLEITLGQNPTAASGRGPAPGKDGCRHRKGAARRQGRWSEAHRTAPEIHAGSELNRTSAGPGPRQRRKPTQKSAAEHTDGKGAAKPHRRERCGESTEQRRDHAGSETNRTVGARGARPPG